MKKLRFVLLSLFLATVGITHGDELPLYGTCNYLPDPPKTWSGMELVEIRKVDDKLGMSLRYHGGTGLWKETKAVRSELENAVSFFRYNFEHDNINETIANEHFVRAVNDVINFTNKYQLHDIKLEWDSLYEFPATALKSLGYFATRAVMFTGVDGGVTVDEFVSLGYTEKCMTKVRITQYVEDPDDPYRYYDYLFQLEKLKKYFEKEPIVTTLDRTDQTYTGETFLGIPYGQGILIYSDGSKYVGEFRQGDYHGYGTFTSEGMTAAGEWNEGTGHGQVTITFPGGEKFVGEMNQGNPWNGAIYDVHGKAYITISEGIETKL